MLVGLEMFLNCPSMPVLCHPICWLGHDWSEEVSEYLCLTEAIDTKLLRIPVPSLACLPALMFLELEVASLH